MEIIDNFLAPDIFGALLSKIQGKDFPWYYQDRFQQGRSKDHPSFPGYLAHQVYDHNIPSSPIYEDLSSMGVLDKLGVDVLLRIYINLNLGHSEQRYYSRFHSDTDNMEASIATLWTTAILYMNTNNGYTEIEDTGEHVNSIANRMVVFPSNIRHRVATQTDTQTRMVVNFNFLK